MKLITNILNKNIEMLTVNLLSNDTELTGDIVINSNIRIDGIVNGNIKCSGKITIGPTAIINGDIDCVDIDISGEINGNIKTENLTLFKETSTFNGKINTSLLNIETGANITMVCNKNY